MLFALTEINTGLYSSTLGNTTFQHELLYADPTSLLVEGEAQSLFSSTYQSCHAYVGPSWTTQLSAVGEWAQLEHKPIVTGGATSPIFAQENFGYVSRSNPSDVYVLKAFAQLIVDYGLDRINVVYVYDAYGQSVAEALVRLSKHSFEVELIRAIKTVDDVEHMNRVLDELQNSPTQVTFLGLSSLETAGFLNAAGKRGMHDTHLWLSPKAVAAAKDLDPPSTGGIWGISYGEELGQSLCSTLPSERSCTTH